MKMQKNKFALVLGITATLCVTVGMTACKKDKKEETLLLGLWNVQYMGSDGNENGILDTDEKLITPDTAKFTFKFNEGGLGETVLTPSIKEGIQTTVPFTWKLHQNGDTVTINAAGKVMAVALTTLTKNVFSGEWGTGKEKTWLYAIK